MIKELYKLICEIQNWLTLNLPAIVSISSVVIASLAWRESKRTRKSSFYPDIIIPDTTIFLEIGDSVVIDGYLWETRFFKFTNEEKQYDNAVEVYPINIGLGVAKMIDFDWVFDLQKMIKLCNKYNQTDFEVVYDDFGDDLELISLVDKVNSNKTYDATNKTDLDNESLYYLIPTHQIKNTSQYFSIPKSLLKFYFYYGIMKHDALNVNREAFYVDNFSEINAPLIKIKYLDVQNNLHKKTFKLIVGAYDTSITNTTVNALNFYLDISFKEVKY